VLAGGQDFHDLFADGALFNAGDEVLDHLEIDVRFQKRQAHLPQCLIDVFFSELAAVAQQFENGVEFFA
jgi:hypothetical protein